MYNDFLKKNGKIYIISGKLKKKKIFIKNNQNIRPTTNRIRETLFNWLANYIINSRCLDCFAGSGALGIEAISRYAKFVTLLELEKKTIFSLKENIKRLNISNLEVIHTNTLDWLKKRRKPYDIVFVDPPYNRKLVDKTIFLLEKNKLIKKRSLIYIEMEKENIFFVPKNWILYKKKITSKIACYLYIFHL